MKSFDNILLILILLLSACKKDKDLGEAITLRNVNNKTKLLNHTKGLDYIISLDEWIINAELIIEPGVEIGVKKGGIIKVLPNAQLSIIGTDQMPIIIKGYKNEAWQGVEINSSKNNIIHSAQIKNASNSKNLTAGIEIIGNGYLKIEKSLIENTAGKSALFVTENAKLELGVLNRFNDCFAPIQMELGAHINCEKFESYNLQVLNILVKNRNNEPLIVNHDMTLKQQIVKYQLNSSLTVDGAKFTVTSGVKILMPLHSKIQTGNNDNNKSMIQFLGSPNNPIEISTLNPKMPWDGVILNEGESRFLNTIFRNIENNDTALGVVTLRNNAVAYINHCDFKYNKTRCSITIQNKSCFINQNVFSVNKLYSNGICKYFK